MKREITTYTDVDITTLIVTVRGQRVILDRDLAAIYGVPTFRFNEAVKRNRSRFPEDFMFQLTREEAASLTSQIAMSKSGRGGRRTLPYAFTEHGALMAANILRSERAIQMSVFVVRAFVLMRRELISRSELEKHLLKVENILLSHDHHIRNLYEKIRPLLLPPAPEPPKKRIGFLVEEPHIPYRSLKRSKMERDRGVFLQNSAGNCFVYSKRMRDGVNMNHSEIVSFIWGLPI